VKRRRFLANAAAAVLGEAALGEATAVAEPAAEPTLPGRVGLADVARLEAVTAQLRGLDYRYGGGAAWDAVVAHVRSAERMLTATMTDTVRPVLHRGVADVHNLAAWTAFDLGLLDHARYHYGRALEHAKQAEDPTLCAFLLCGAGHVYLFHDAPDEALKFFQLAEYPAAESRIGLIHLVTSCYQARAYSELGVADRAVGLVARSEDVYAAAIDADGIPNWLWYFCAGGRHSLRANVHAALSRQHPAHLTPALEAMRASVNEHQPGLERGNVIDLAGLATLHLRAGNVNHGLRLGHAVVGKAEVVASRHVRDRLRPLAAAAARVGGADGRDLARAVHRAVG
jgi:tetratricopeptide (TPR) repeat protein